MWYLFFSFFLVGSVFSAPDFLIIGVTKGGTTSLYDYLIQHPNILGAKRKELNFFNRPRMLRKGMSYYNSRFPVKNNSKDLIGEATPFYFHDKRCAQRISEACPNTKLILILRNPVKRAVSHYYFFNKKQWSRKWYDLSFEAAIRASRINKREIIDQGYYFDICMHWLKYFPREQIHIIILEDLEKNPELEVNKVFNFLGLSNFTINSYLPKNQGKYTNGSITPESIKALEELYKPHNKKLENFLRRILPWS